MYSLCNSGITVARPSDWIEVLSVGGTSYGKPNQKPKAGEAIDLGENSITAVLSNEHAVKCLLTMVLTVDYYCFLLSSRKLSFSTRSG